MKKLRTLVLTLNSIIVLIPILFFAAIHLGLFNLFIVPDSDLYLWVFWILVGADIILMIIYSILKRKYKYVPEGRKILYWIIVILYIIYFGLIIYYTFIHDNSVCCVLPPDTTFPIVIPPPAIQ